MFGRAISLSSAPSNICIVMAGLGFYSYFRTPESPYTYHLYVYNSPYWLCIKQEEYTLVPAERTAFSSVAQIFGIGCLLCNQHWCWEEVNFLRFVLHVQSWYLFHPARGTLPGTQKVNPEIDTTQIPLLSSVMEHSSFGELALVSVLERTYIDITTIQMQISIILHL